MALTTQSEPVAVSFDGSLEYITRGVIVPYKAGLPPDESPNTAEIREKVFEATQNAFNELNLMTPKGHAKFTVPQSLRPIQIVMCILEFDAVRNVQCSDDGQEPLLRAYPKIKKQGKIGLENSGITGVKKRMAVILVHQK